MRTVLALMLAVSAAAQTRLSNQNVTVVAPPGWRLLTRGELADPPPLFAAMRDKSSFQIAKSKLPQSDWNAFGVAAATMPLMLLQFRSGAVETPIHDTTFAGMPAAEWTATYTIERPKDGFARVISIVVGDSYYTIVASGPVATRDELESVAKSVTIAR